MKRSCLARAAWAGSQRYPLHWGGDAATTNTGMLGTLRAGLSFGLSGFSFWSYDMGGFVKSTPEDLYCRWLPFGFLTSHTRAHGAPPTEPWLYDSKRVQDVFRKSAEMKYRLMPYVYAQAKECTEKGLPMLRELCSWNSLMTLEHGRWTMNISSVRRFWLPPCSNPV